MTARDSDSEFDDLGVVNAFLQRFLADSEDRGVQGVEQYAAAYPGYEDLIRRKYAELCAREVSAPSAPADFSGVATFAGGAAAPRSAPSAADAPCRPPGSGAPALAGTIDAERVGPYRLLKKLGEGGMGSVHLAEQTEPIRRRVALKQIKLGMDTREVVARFQAERQALAVMDHPAIARVIDAGQTPEGRPYFVMEYVEGTPLIAFADRHRLDTRARLELFSKLLDGIQHAHQKGIIHRDLKPSNVLVSGSGADALPKVIDFGIAKSLAQPLTAHADLTQTGQIVGTPVYMSPEQIGMAPGDVDTRSDIYSLGVVLYELLSGTLPFEVAELRQLPFGEIQRRIIAETPPRPSTRLARLGERSETVAATRNTRSRTLARVLRRDLDWIVMKALEKDPGRRYASVSEFAADVRRYLRDEPVLAGRPSFAYRAAKLARRHRVGLSVAGLVVLLVAAFAVWSAYDVGRRRLETVRQRLARGDAQMAALAEARTELAAAKRELAAAIAALPAWEPVWKRAEELRLRQRVDELQTRLGGHLTTAFASFLSAYEMALEGSEERLRARTAGEAVSRMSTVELGIGIKEDLLGILVQEVLFQRADRDAAEPPALATVGVESDPPGANVECYRYELASGRFAPLPFDARGGHVDAVRGLRGGTVLAVERVWEPARCPFLAGDRILAVGGHRVQSEGDVIGALASTGAGETVAVRALRDGAAIELAWTPFPAGSACARADCVVSFLDAFGFSFAGYPLDAARASAGATPARLRLPAGSYLLVLRAPGCAEARVPYVVAPPQAGRASANTLRVYLPPAEDAPPGFVYVAAGRFLPGNDPEVDAPLEVGEKHVDGFFMARFEVTFAEYLEFLNDPRAGVAADGTVAPRAPAVRALVARRGEASLAVIPILHDKRENRDLPLCRFAGGVWTLALPTTAPDHPVLAVSMLAAEEYAFWFAERHGGRWTFRLPGDLEWEKAARGADGRYYVWGNYPLWSFCRSPKAIDGPGRPAPVGAYPFDESPYGVRDLAGSAAEPTRDLKEGDFRSKRGGSWYSVTDYFFRAANRNGSYPWAERAIDTGIRLVAPLPAESR